VTETAEVVIIGGGVEGLSTARALVERGVRDVVVLERDTIGSGGTGKSSGIVRCHYGVRSLAAMAWASLPVLEAAPEVLGDEVGFERTGYLVGVGPNNVDALKANVATQREVGVDVELIDHAAAGELWPTADLEEFAAFAFEPRGGYGDAYQTAQAFARAARRGGARVRQQTPVTAIEVRGGRVLGVRLADGGYVGTPAVVVAAGTWSVPLVAGIGIELPIRAQRAQILIVNPARPIDGSPVFSDLVSLQYMRREGRGSMLVGDSDHSQPEWADADHYSNVADDDLLFEAITKFEHRFPGLADSTLSSTYAGCYDTTPDYNPVISPCPVDGLWICAGFSGHGYKISPAVGELTADLVCFGGSKNPDIDHHDFRWERFSEGQLLLSPHPYEGAAEMR
jgi:glycine/D-amino acid oxidase-like deaminating enzyme